MEFKFENKQTSKQAAAKILCFIGKSWNWSDFGGAFGLETWISIACEQGICAGETGTCKRMGIGESQEQNFNKLRDGDFVIGFPFKILAATQL